MRLYKYIETKAIRVQLRFLHNANYIKKSKHTTTGTRQIATATATEYPKRHGVVHSQCVFTAPASTIRFIQRLLSARITSRLTRVRSHVGASVAERGVEKRFYLFRGYFVDRSE